MYFRMVTLLRQFLCKYNVWSAQALRFCHPILHLYYVATRGHRYSVFCALLMQVYRTLNSLQM
jgi:hypothetical protein